MENPAYADAYVAYLAHFHGTRDYFECHELLEEHWKQENDPVLKEIWHGLIQVAVSLYHERRGNFPGSRKMLEQAILHLTRANPGKAGLDQSRLLELLRARYALLAPSPVEQMDRPMVFEDMTLPVADDLLLQEAKAMCASWGYEWGRTSPMDDKPLILRHLLRDRTDVVAERARQLAIRRQNQQGLAEREDS